MAINALSRKLGLKPNMSALIVGGPPGYLKSLEPLPPGVVITDKVAGTHQFVQLFATWKAEMKKSAPKLLKAADSGALVWMTYPKKTSGVESDLSREEVWSALEGTGWRPVAQIAIDEVWSALRFRPMADVKSR